MTLAKITLAAALTFACAAAPAFGAEWGPAVEVQHQYKTCVSYQAKFDGPYLVVRAQVADGWHTFAMDNELRAEEKLAGQMSLGVDAPTEISLGPGLALAGPWLQSAPNDFSKPEMRWYSWGFEGEALFAAKVTHGSGPSVINLQGQACSDSTCKNIDLEITVPAGGAGSAGFEPARLVAVRTKK